MSTKPSEDQNPQLTLPLEREGFELFSTVDGQKEDALLHETIIKGADRAKVYQRAVENARAIGLSEEDINNLYHPPSSAEHEG